MSGTGLAEREEFFELTTTGLKVHGKPSFTMWQAEGDKLKRIEGAIHWWLGDWLNYGERAYGEKYSQALDETEFSYKTLRTDSWVAHHIEVSRRGGQHSWSHHREVAVLEPTEQDKLLDIAEEKGLSRQKLRQAVREIQALPSPDLPDDKYRIIYADPPWQYENKGMSNYGHAETHYDTLSVAELSALSIMSLAADNAVLFMWTTSAILEDAFPIIRAWGFEYKSSFIWDKVKHNYGHYNSVRHELLLIATRGSCVPDVAKLFDSVQVIERTTKHSEKPEAFRKIIDTLYPNGKRIELFARNPAEGWDVWGNEV